MHVDLPEATTPDPAAESFYAGALRRISRSMLILSALGLAVVFFRFGWPAAAGFALGALLAYWNFEWLKRGVSAMADRITQTQQGRRRGWVVPLFLLRYFLAGVAGYALYRLAPGSLRGFLAGLFLPVAAIFAEAGYDIYGAIVRNL